KIGLYEWKNTKPVMTSARKTNAGRRGGWLQLATYPQSPFSGPARCCDVTDLYQAFSQRTGPGRLWISLGALLQQPISATEKQLTTAQPFRRSVIHLSAMYPNRCQRSFRSKHSVPSDKSVGPYNKEKNGTARRPSLPEKRH